MNIIEELWYILRIFIALMLGFAIGVERKMRYKDAGECRRDARYKICSTKIFRLVRKYLTTKRGGGKISVFLERSRSERRKLSVARSPEGFTG